MRDLLFWILMAVFFIGAVTIGFMVEALIGHGCKWLMKWRDKVREIF